MIVPSTSKFPILRVPADRAERIPVAIPHPGAVPRHLDGAVPSPRLTLFGGVAGDVLVYRTQGPAGSATAELSQYLQPGVYFLEAGGAGAYRLITTFTAGATTTETVPVPFGALAVAAGDVNHDGRLDLVTVAESAPPFYGHLAVLLGNDGGTFAPGPATDGMLTDPRALAVADLNGDGSADVAVATAGPPGEVVYLGVGDGSFRPGAALPLDPAGAAVALAVADFDGDGNPDLVVGSAGDATVRTFLGDGAGRFRGATPVGVGAGLAASRRPTSTGTVSGTLS